LRITIGEDKTTVQTVTAIYAIPLSQRRLQGAVARYVWHRYRLRIDRYIAKDILHRIGSAYPLACELGMIVCVEGHRVLITSEEIRGVLRAPLTVLTDALRALPKTEAVYLRDTELRGLDLLITEETGLNCYIF